jgi:putative transposase
LKAIIDNPKESRKDWMLWLFEGAGKRNPNNKCIENKGLEVCAWCMMTNHVHLIIGSKGDNKLEDIGRDIKSHTSKSLLKAIIDNPKESRKDWMLWLFEGAGKRNPNNKNYSIISL